VVCLVDGNFVSGLLGNLSSSISRTVEGAVGGVNQSLQGVTSSVSNFLAPLSSTASGVASSTRFPSLQEKFTRAGITSEKETELTKKAFEASQTVRPIQTESMLAAGLLGPVGSTPFGQSVGRLFVTQTPLGGATRFVAEQLPTAELEKERIDAFKSSLRTNLISAGVPRKDVGVLVSRLQLEKQTLQRVVGGSGDLVIAEIVGNVVGGAGIAGFSKVIPKAPQAIIKGLGTAVGGVGEGIVGVASEFKSRSYEPKFTDLLTGAIFGGVAAGSFGTVLGASESIAKKFPKAGGALKTGVEGVGQAIDFPFEIFGDIATPSTRVFVPNVGIVPTSTKKVGSVEPSKGQTTFAPSIPSLTLDPMKKIDISVTSETITDVLPEDIIPIPPSQELPPRKTFADVPIDEPSDTLPEEEVPISVPSMTSTSIPTTTTVTTPKFGFPFFPLGGGDVGVRGISGRSAFLNERLLAKRLAGGLL